MLFHPLRTCKILRIKTEIKRVKQCPGYVYFWYRNWYYWSYWKSGNLCCRSLSAITLSRGQLVFCLALGEEWHPCFLAHTLESKYRWVFYSGGKSSYHIITIRPHLFLSTWYIDFISEANAVWYIGLVTLVL